MVSYHTCNGYQASCCAKRLSSSYVHLPLGMKDSASIVKAFRGGALPRQPAQYVTPAPAVWAKLCAYGIYAPLNKPVKIDVWYTRRRPPVLVIDNAERLCASGAVFGEVLFAAQQWADRGLVRVIFVSSDDAVVTCLLGAPALA